MSRKRVKPKTGDVFAVPLFDGTYGLGHLAFYDGMAMCALFPSRAENLEDLHRDLDGALVRPVTVLVLTAAELRSGEWPIIGFKEPSYPAAWLPKFRTEGAMSSTATAGPGFLAAYHGLTPWDAMADPKYYERQLLPGVPVPATVRYRRDFAPSAQSAPAAQPEPSSQITEGPAEIRIAILYPGKGLPTVEQLHKRQELERRLEEENAGEITDAGGGEGVMDIYLETDDVQRAMPIVEQLVSELGLAADTLIEAGPVDEEEDDDR